MILTGTQFFWTAIFADSRFTRELHGDSLLLNCWPPLTVRAARRIIFHVSAGGIMQSLPRVLILVPILGYGAGYRTVNTGRS